MELGRCDSASASSTCAPLQLGVFESPHSPRLSCAPSLSTLAPRCSFFRDSHCSCRSINSTKQLATHGLAGQPVRSAPFPGTFTLVSLLTRHSENDPFFPFIRATDVYLFSTVAHTFGRADDIAAFEPIKCVRWSYEYFTSSGRNSSCTASRTETLTFVISQSLFIFSCHYRWAFRARERFVPNVCGAPARENIFGMTQCAVFRDSGTQ